MMHIVNHIEESIWRMGSGDTFTTDIVEQRHLSIVKEADQSTNKLNYIQLMLMHNDRSTGLDYMENQLSYLALQRWNDIDSENVFNLLSSVNKW
jgi:hypothetical protein